MWDNVKKAIDRAIEITKEMNAGIMKVGIERVDNKYHITFRIDHPEDVNETVLKIEKEYNLITAHTGYKYPTEIDITIMVDAD